MTPFHNPHQLEEDEGFVVWGYTGAIHAFRHMREPFRQEPWDYAIDAPLAVPAGYCWSIPGYPSWVDQAHIMRDGL